MYVAWQWYPGNNILYWIFGFSLGDTVATGGTTRIDTHPIDKHDTPYAIFKYHYRPKGRSIASPACLIDMTKLQVS